MWLEQSECRDESTEGTGRDCEALGGLHKDRYWVKWEPI